MDGTHRWRIARGSYPLKLFKDAGRHDPAHCRRLKKNHQKKPPLSISRSVVELNRAVAHSRAFGPAVGLELVDALTDQPSLKNYHLLPSVCGDLLAKLGRPDEARVEFERAASLTQNGRERALLLERAASGSG